MTLRVFGIPSCGTVKKARAWLEARQIAHEFVDLRADPPDEARVARWAESLGVRALRNTSGASFRALGPERETWAEERWVRAFCADPMLIKRPVIERDGRPVQVGFADADAELEARLIG